jgi:predicted RND superfamily exporter protein
VMQDFGFHAAIAVMTTFLGVMMVIPVWLSFLSIEKVGSPVSKSKWEERYFSWLEKLIWDYPRQIMGIFLLLTIGTGFYVRDMKANSNIMEMFHSEHPTRKAIEVVDSQLSGIVPIMLSLEREEDSVLDVDLLRKMQIVEAEMERYDFVLWKYSLASQLEAIHYAFSEERSLPTSSEMIAQELLMVEMTGELPLDRILSEDQKLTRALFLCRDVGGIGFLAMKKEMDQKIAEVFGDQSNIRVEFTGDGILASTGINKLILDLISSVFVVFIVIFGVLLLMLRKIPMAIIALIPNALPLLLTLATLKILGSDLQVTNIVSFTVAIGLAVDDTIHFIARYQSERKAGKEHREAMQASFHGAGHAIILTSILLVLGFGFLATSSLSSTSFFGILTAVTLIGAIFADLFLLPAMMNWWEQRSETKYSQITDKTE